MTRAYKYDHMKPLFNQQEFNLAKLTDRLQLQCSHCNEPFLMTKRAILECRRPSSRRLGNFCSRNCKLRAQTKPLANLCKSCKAPCKKLFCSTKCANGFQRAKHQCRTCKSKITANKTYCCSACKFHELDERINSGLVSDRSVLKKFLHRNEITSCQECGLDTWKSQRLSLELDHINGNASDNFPQNLRLLCPNCHSITPTWKGKNRGKGRKSRQISVT